MEDQGRGLASRREETLTYKEYFLKYSDHELAELALDLQDSIDFGSFGVRDVTMLDQAHRELTARGYDSIYEAQHNE